MVNQSGNTLFKSKFFFFTFYAYIYSAFIFSEFASISLLPASHTPRPSMLASRSLIGKGARLNLNCNADVLGLSLEVTAILTLTFSRSPDSESGEKQIAVWQPYQGEDEEIKEKHASLNKLLHRYK